LLRILGHRERYEISAAFLERASPLSGNDFTMLTAYSDETGTGGIPQSGKEPAPGMYGLIASTELWEDFREKWKAELNRYGVDYFHFRELHPNELKKPGNPFYGWNKERVDDFIYDMAILVGSGPIPFGGNVSQKLTTGANPTPHEVAKLYRKLFYTFFDDFKNVMNDHFPNESEKVAFFFSELNNDVWTKILSQIIKDARHHNPIIGEYTYLNPKCQSGSGIPCQAADLFAYVNRQNSSNMYEAGMVRRMRILDLVIGRFVFPKNNPSHILRSVPDKEWRGLVADMRQEKKKFETENQKPGGSKPEYFPTLHHAGLRKLFGPYLKS
jgi:hypothetical protein